MIDRIDVVGAGVAGLVTALVLARRGVEVVVWDADPLAEGGCTAHGGGMLAPVSELDHAEPWVVALGGDSAARWRALLPEAPPSVLQADGILAVAHRPDWPLLDELVDRAARAGAGARVQRVDGDGIAAREPALAGRFARGVWLPDEGVVHPLALRRWLRAAIEQAGGSVRSGVTVEVSDLGARVDGALLSRPFVDARGMGAAADLPLRPVRGEYVRLSHASVALSRPVRVMHPRYPLYVIPRGEGRVYVGATQTESDEQGGAHVRSALELLTALYSVHPGFADARIDAIGVGHRPALPSNRPLVRVDRDRVVINGLFRHGFLLAPVLATTVAERLAGRAPSSVVAPFVDERAA